MYALGLLGPRSFAGEICVAGAVLGALHTPWGLVAAAVPV